MIPKLHLRLVFVQLLFALTIGQLALKIGDMIIGRHLDMNHFWVDLVTYPYLYSHLVLCVFLITTSWIGWQASQSSDSPQASGFVISVEFLVLLLDLFLVICYFIIVRGAELSTSSAAIKESQVQFLYEVKPPDSEVERFWIALIFCVYLIWDVLTKIINKRYIKVGDNEYKFRIEIDTSRKMVGRALITLVCFIASYLIYFFFTGQTKRQVFYVDIMLIAVIWGFRGWKQKVKREHYELQAEQIPTGVLKRSNISIESFPITILESPGLYRFKYFVSKILPIVLLVFFAILYFTV